MSKYVNAADAAEKIAEKHGIRIADLCDTFGDIPAADVVEVRHGRWERVIPTKSAAKWSTKVSCSNCHSVGYMRYNYCPNCGALMDKEEK